MTAGHAHPLEPTEHGQVAPRGRQNLALQGRRVLQKLPQNGPHGTWCEGGRTSTEKPMAPNAASRQPLFVTVTKVNIDQQTSSEGMDREAFIRAALEGLDGGWEGESEAEMMCGASAIRGEGSAPQVAESDELVWTGCCFFMDALTGRCIYFSPRFLLTREMIVQTSARTGESSVHACPAWRVGTGTQQRVWQPLGQSAV
jgi:hypothetical protein